MASDYRDFYIKYDGHPNYNDGILQTESQTDLVVNKLEMILATNNGDFIADPEFGANLTHYLWETNASAIKIKQAIVGQINKYIPELNKTEYRVNVSISKGTLRDIMLVDIIINDRHIKAVMQ